MKDSTIERTKLTRANKGIITKAKITKFKERILAHWNQFLQKQVQQENQFHAWTQPMMNLETQYLEKMNGRNQ